MKHQPHNISNLPLFLLLSLSTYDITLQEENVESQFTLILNFFQGCHLKLILGGESSENFDILSNALLHIVNSNSPYSTQPILKNSTDIENCTLKNHYKVARYAICFLHAYSETVLSENGRNYTSLEKVMNGLRCSGEWPHHFFFLGNFKEYSVNQINARNIFYRKKLAETFTRGLVFSIDTGNMFPKSGSVHLLCIPCETTLVHFNSAILNEVSTDMPGLPYPLLKSENFRGVYINLSNPQWMEIEQGCDFAKANFRPKYHQRWHAVCVFRQLQDPLNLTFFTSDFFDEDTDAASFITMISFYICTWNHDEMSETRAFEWTPYNLRIGQYQFVGFQERPQLSVALLIKPYDWKSWVAFSISLMAVVVLKLLANFRNIQTKDILDLVLYLFSSCLEQPTFKDSIFTTSENILGAHQAKLGIYFCLFMWTVMMVVFSTGYKGMIFSLLAKSSGASWPQNVAELINDPSYIMFSNERIYDTQNGKTVVIPMLVDFFSEANMEGTPGKDYRMEYFLLNRTLPHTFFKDTVDVASDIIWQSKLSTTGMYHIGNATSDEFAFLHREPLEFSALITNFFPELIASAPTVIPGIERINPWTISRNFFHSRFLKSLARLEQTGFMLAIQRHRARWSTCNSLAATQDKLEKEFKMTQEDERWSANAKRCLNQALAGKTVGTETSSDVKALSIRQLMGTFQIFLFVQGIALILFVVEVILYSIQKWKAFKELRNVED